MWLPPAGSATLLRKQFLLRLTEHLTAGDTIWTRIWRRFLPSGSRWMSVQGFSRSCRSKTGFAFPCFRKFLYFMARKCYYIFSACACLDRWNVSHEVVKRFNLVHQLVQLVYDLLDVRNKSKSVVLHFHLHFFNIVLLGSGCHLPLVLLLRILLHFFFSSSPPLSQTRNGHVWKWKIVFPLAKSSSRWERLNSHMPNELLLLLRLVFLAPLQLVHYISMNIAMDGSHKWHKVCFSSTRGVEPSPDDSQTFNVDCLWFQVGWLLLHSFSLLGKWLIFFPCNYDFFF